MMKRTLLLALAFSLALGLRAEDEDLNLINAAVSPFSDQASHFVLLRPQTPSAGAAQDLWVLKSAAAWGGATAVDRPDKQLLSLSLGLDVEGHAGLPWAAEPSQDYPRWSLARASAQGLSLSVESATVFAETDVLLVVASFKNLGSTSVKVQPFARFSTQGQVGRWQAKAEPGGVVLQLDRSALLGCRAHEALYCAAASNPVLPLFEGQGLEAGGQSFSSKAELLLKGEAQVLKPGSGLRFPLLVSLDEESGRAIQQGRAAWKAWALKPGLALEAAKRRWAQTRLHLAQPVEPEFGRLARQAALTLLMSEYKPRGGMGGSLFSAAKGWRDDFFGPEMALAALGWAELDMGKAQEALQQASSASSQGLPCPPYRGQEPALWEAGSLPLHAWVGTELYERDGDRQRATAFMQAWGDSLRAESAWWVKRGDAEGLWSYGADVEPPSWAHWLAPSTALAGSPTASADLALNALLANQLSVAAQVAEARGETQEAAALSQRARSVLQRLSATATASLDDSLWPLLLGMQGDAAEGRRALLERVKDPEFLPVDPRKPPLAENGVLVPWRALMVLESLERWGEFEKASQARRRLLLFLSSRPALHEAYDAQGQPLGAPGDAATAASALYLCLDRQAQETALCPDTRALAGRFRRIRALDGGLELRFKPSLAKATLPQVSLAAPQGGAVMEEGAFLLSVDGPGSLVLESRLPMDVSLLATGARLFKGTHKAALILKPKARYLFEFKPSSPRSPAP